MTDGLGQFAPAVASWRKLMAAMPDDRGRWEIFTSAAQEFARYVTKGLDRVLAVDTLHEIATTHGLTDVDAEQQVIADAFHEIELEPRVPEPEVRPQPKAKANGKDHAPAESEPIAVFRPFPMDEKTIPPRDWIIPGFLMRKHVTVLVAPSGAGKSLLTLQLGIACALHIEWGGWRPRHKSRVLMINSEDDLDEMRRRLAALARLSAFDQTELRDNFMLAEIPDGIVVAKFDARTKTLVRTPRLAQVIATIKKYQIDVVFVDPFAETFEGDENSNSELKWAGVYWREVARLTNVAICLVHHTKKYATGMAGDVDAARGAGALIGIARIVSTIFPMTTKEAEAMLDENEQKNRGQYFRYDDAKANLNLTSVVARWFRKDTVTLDNATAGQPADEVGALVAWKPKGFLDGILEDQIIRFLQRVDRGILDKATGEPSGEFYTFDTRKASEHEMSRYVGEFIMEFFGINLEHAAKLLEVWRKNRRLVEADKYRSPRTRKDRSRCLSELAIRADAAAQTQPDEQQTFLPEVVP